MVIENCFSPGPGNTHTNKHCGRGRPTIKDVERQFRNGPFRALEKNAKITRKITRYAQRNSEEKRNTNSLASTYSSRVNASIVSSLYSTVKRLSRDLGSHSLPCHFSRDDFGVGYVDFGKSWHFRR